MNFQIFLTISVLLLFSCGKITHEKFDSYKWKTLNLNTEENWDLRWNMMNDLRNNYQLNGRSKSEIIKLLGNPDNESNNEFYYYLGYTGKGINTGSLYISFNQQNKVVKIEVFEG